ncbi:MAG: aminotransferase class V-fold PLP-dependent enzyme, partial [bacterium]|nr:aminotransferase class V-fold PLP-dependent enzyme [bacterium]
MPLKLPIYLDYQATTPVDPRVFEAMHPYFMEEFGNAASNHCFGWKARAAVDIAREQVAELIKADDPKEIIWTSGATESNNLALIGAARQYKEKGDEIITCVTEHPAVLDPARYLEQKGFKITCLPVDPEGLIRLDQLQEAITQKTILVSLMAANNEIGVLHPIQEVGKICKEKGILFHVDAAQGCGKIPINVQEMGIDLLS